jgi:uncharacterized glyoxalase superfamily protein PhnB
MSASTVTLWHSFSVRDAAATADWLRAVGFVEHATYRDEHDPTVVVHAEWLWEGPTGTAGVMWGTDRPDGGVHDAGHASAYLVCDDPAAVAERAVAAGGTLVQPVTDKDYGGAGGTVRDPDGNSWSLGTYQPS